MLWLFLKHFLHITLNEAEGRWADIGGRVGGDDVGGDDVGRGIAL
jgi:hypothetical protein